MTTTKEAAIKWWRSLPERTWIQMQNKYAELKNTGEPGIISMYLKEHEGKEESIEDREIRQQYQHAAMDEQPEVSLPVSEKEIIICENCKEYHIAPMSACVYCGGKSFEKTHPSNLAHVKNWNAGHFINQYPASTEETLEEGVREFARKEILSFLGGKTMTKEREAIVSQYANGAVSGAAWQKRTHMPLLKEIERQAALLHEQNGIIYDLLHALSNAMQYVPFDCGTKEDCRSAITKAEQFLGTK